MIPFLIFEILSGITRMILFHISIREAIYNTLTLQCNLGSNWFIATLFFAEILFYFSYRLGRIISLVLAFVCIFFVPDYAPIEGNLRTVILRILIALAFINIGYFAKEIWKYQNNLIMCLCLLGLIISYFCNIQMELWDVSITNPLLYTVRALMGTYLVLSISKIINNKFLIACGANSLGIMLTHHLIKYYIEATGLVTNILILALSMALGSCLVYVCLLLLER